MSMPTPSKKRIGIMGGSFDPVHFGHLIVAQDAFERLELSKIILIPAAVAPHKQYHRQESAEHRLNMLTIAIEMDLRFEVADIEISRGGTSYTVDTITELKNSYPDDDLFFIVGSDTLVELHTWKSFDKLLTMCEIVTLTRPGDDVYSTISEQVQQPPDVKEKLMEMLIDAHKVEISSTEIRMRIAEGLSIRYLVPPEVEMYIYEHGLYRG